MLHKHRDTNVAVEKKKKAAEIENIGIGGKLSIN